MKKTTLKLNKGDYIVHAAHGIGKVRGTDIKTLRGTKRTYYQVKTNDLTYWLPVENSSSERVRMVCAPSTFRKALGAIREKPEILSNNFRVRVSRIKEVLAKCSLSANTRLLRDLNARHAIKDLHINELRVLDRLKNQFTSEFAVACSIELKEAEARLEDALLEGLSKLPKGK